MWQVVWVKRGSESDCVCVCVCVCVCRKWFFSGVRIMYICMRLWIRACTNACVNRWGKEENKNRGLRSWSKKKKEGNSCMRIDTLARVWFRARACVYVCQWLSLKSEEKRLVFPRLCFIQQDTHIHGPERIPRELWLHSSGRKGGLSFNHLFLWSICTAKHDLMKTVCGATRQLDRYSHAPCDWIHHAGAPKLWPLWKWTWSVNLSPVTPSPVTWLAKPWPFATSLVKGEAAVLGRSGRATANNTLRTFNTWRCWLKLSVLNHSWCGGAHQKCVFLSKSKSDDPFCWKCN